MNTSTKKTERAAAVMNDPRWSAVVNRDHTADGTFYYAVQSTGVYCRPSCASRRANPENITFFATRAEAEGAGFRACRRCKPDRPDQDRHYAEIVSAACRMIDEAERHLNLTELASQAGLSTYHFHRIFKQVTGLTPKDYAAARREEKIRSLLGQPEKITAGTVTEAIYEAGYNANSRFYAKSQEVLGMTPNDYRTGGANADIRFAIGECSLGSILVARSELGVCSILLGDDPSLLVRDLQDRFPRANLIGGDADFEQLVARVVGFVEAPQVGLDLPLDVRGTAFQKRVWQALREIPPGQTASYTDLANRIGAPKSARAVAQACAANPLAVAIPCHRVVRTGGDLAGYRWGVERKRALLEREAGLT